MLAASYWSLLAPAIELAEQSGTYGQNGELSFLPVATGFALGALFVYFADRLLPYLGVSSPNIALAIQTQDKFHSDENEDFQILDGELQNDSSTTYIGLPENGPLNTTQRRRGGNPSTYMDAAEEGILSKQNLSFEQRKNSWRRILLLIIAITVHNIPEGLAVGVGFGAVGKTPTATFESARNLALGIGIQNFPEGLAVSLPLRGSGYSKWKSFWYGQLSGMVEPLAGVFGAVAMVIAEPLLPYALAFAAGAMVYVVVNDIIPEAQTSGNGVLASWGCIVGFIVMMSLDVGLG
ncbi:zinc transporter ZIP11-like isoform X2 [Ptychodera flava]